MTPEAFASAPQKSIDYAVMEKTDRAAVVAGNFRWSDIGSWDAIFDIAERDKSGNAIHGTVVTTDARNCVIHSVDRLTAVLGADDLVVVSTPDAVLVVPRARAQEVRELVAKLKGAQRPEATEHRRGHRPWGYYDFIDQGERFQVKRIVVRPGGTLSLQKHHHRAEHWVVVRGTAEVTIGTDVKAVHENEFDLHPDRRGPPPRQPGQDPARADRGADRQLSGRGRHRADRGRLQAKLTDRAAEESRYNRKEISRRCPDLARSIAACPAFPPTPLSRPEALSSP